MQQSFSWFEFEKKYLTISKMVYETKLPILNIHGFSATLLIIYLSSMESFDFWSNMNFLPGLEFQFAMRPIIIWWGSIQFLGLRLVTNHKSCVLIGQNDLVPIPSQLRPIKYLVPGWITAIWYRQEKLLNVSLYRSLLWYCIIIPYWYNCSKTI